MGGAGKAQVLFAQHAPAMFDRVAAVGSALFINPTKSQPRSDNLFAPAHNGVERSRDRTRQGIQPLYRSDAAIGGHAGTGCAAAGRHCSSGRTM